MDAAQILLFRRVFGGFNCAPTFFFFFSEHFNISFRLNRKYKFFIHKEGSACKLDLDVE